MGKGRALLEVGMSLQMHFLSQEVEEMTEHEIGPQLRQRIEKENPESKQKSYKTRNFKTCELHNSEPRGPLMFCEDCCGYFKKCYEWAKGGYV